LQPRGSGAPRSSVVERELERRGRKEEELRHIQREIDGTRRVLDCLQILPPDSRRIIERVYLKQESPLRVALDLEVGERTIKVWLRRSMLVVWLALATDWKPAG
jgi:DNA-directed RNA polymerase specialized sigma24 family protein